MIVVSTYKSPDLDGIACAIAYTEFLNINGIDAKAYYFGDLGLEVNFVKTFLSELKIEKHTGNYHSDDRFVLVDTSDPDAIEESINVENVVEIYDHRELIFTDAFHKANAKIELVGSCATLIAEEFNRKELSPSSDSALLLYSAIISNTVNFLNTVTTERDMKMARWLKQFISIPKDYIYKMFNHKSNITKDNLYEVLEQDFSVKEFGTKKVGIAQLEVVELKKKFKTFKSEFKYALERLISEDSIDYILFTGVDVFEGFNIFYTVGDNSNRFFAKVLNTKELDKGVLSEGIVMRKQIWPLIANTIR
ncbi:MAG: DHH family phosphoesterase [Candidatus Dojkabacteria bacterium]|nr:DHH family phosphoesterase [Candidatus Dojkabacteria bacterium]